MLKDSFREFLPMAMSESLILFDQKFYKQHDGGALSSPLRPKKFDFKIIILNLNLLPIEGTLMIHSYCLARNFQNYLNGCHKNIILTSETDNENSISFLDIKISRDNNKFTTSVSHKPTFNRVFINFGTSIPKSYKYNFLLTLSHITQNIKNLLKFGTFSSENKQKLKTNFKNNGYLKSFVDFCIENGLHKVFI